MIFHGTWGSRTPRAITNRHSEAFTKDDSTSLGWCMPRYIRAVATASGTSTSPQQSALSQAGRASTAKTIASPT
ncbi:hypothetical protein GCM10023107_01850 [Actinoplanes octamycinicus]